MIPPYKTPFGSQLTTKEIHMLCRIQQEQLTGGAMVTESSEVIAERIIAQRPPKGIAPHPLAQRSPEEEEKKGV